MVSDLLFQVKLPEILFLNFNKSFLCKFASISLHFLDFTLTGSLISFILCRIITSCITLFNFLAYSSFGQEMSDLFKS